MADIILPTLGSQQNTHLNFKSSQDVAYIHVNNPIASRVQKASSTVSIPSISMLVDITQQHPKTIKKMRRDGTIRIESEEQSNADKMPPSHDSNTERPFFEELKDNSVISQISLNIGDKLKIRDSTITRMTSNLRDIVDEIPKLILLPDDKMVTRWGIVVLMYAIN